MANQSEVVKKNESNVVPFDESILLEDAGSSQDGMTKDDILMPRLGILQQMSDQINKRHGDYVDGAEAGHIFDNVAKTAHDGEKGITVVPISYRRAHIEWKPDRGGLVNDHGSDSSCLENCTRGEKGEYMTSDGNQIVITGEFVVYVLDDNGGYFPALLSMSGSQFKKAKQWNAMITRLMVPIKGKSENPAMFWTAYQLTTVPESNDLGSWFGWAIKMKYDAASGGIIKNHKSGSDIYLAARAMKKGMADGEIKVSPESQDDDVM